MSRSLSPEARKASGSHYTPPRLAQFVADAMVSAWRAEDPVASVEVLDPAAGDGQLLLAALRELAKHPDAQVTATGFDTDEVAVALASSCLREAYPGATVRIERRDFLDVALVSDAAGHNLFTEPGAHRYDLVIANPPYVRTQVMGAERAQQLSADFGLSGRVDLYFAFLRGIASVLKPGGIAGVIVSNRFMTTRAGAAVRKAIREQFDVLHVWDLGDTKLFEAAVLPAVLLLRKKDRRIPAGAPLFTSIYTTSAKESAVQCEHPLDALYQNGVFSCTDGQLYLVRHGTLDSAAPAEAIWRVATEAGDEWLARAAAHTYCTFGDVGKIRVGVKTTADRIFAPRDWAQVPEDERPELLRPLTTRHIGRRYKAEPPNRQIIYPHEVVEGKRRAVDLTLYPRSLRYLSQFREELESRSYVTDSGRKWYEIWVPQDPDSWAAPKVVFPDIAERPTFWMDLSGSVVNGDCYYVTTNGQSSDLLWLLLAVANSTFIEAFYDHRFHNKLYSGRRRFMTQYVEQFPLPDPATPLARKIVAVVRSIYDFTPSPEAEALERDLDFLVWEAFGLTKEEVAR